MQVFEPRAPEAVREPHALPDDLIVPAIELFNAPALSEALKAQLDRNLDSRDLRGEIVTLLSETRATAVARIEAAFALQPFAARPLTRAYSWLTDRIVCFAFDAATTHLNPLPDNS